MFASIFRSSQRLHQDRSVELENNACVSMHSVHESVAGRRKSNQDLCYHDDELGIYMVADGMGGYEGGELASEIVVATIPPYLACVLRETDADRNVLIKRLQSALEIAVQQAVCEMDRISQLRPRLNHMGCTLAIAVVANKELYVANIGDPRVYLLHHHKLEQLTHDQSLVQQLVDAELISEADAANHRWKHVVTNSLGAKGINEMPRWSRFHLVGDDEVLLTTDGLTNELSNTEIASRLLTFGDLEMCVEILVQDALERDAKDNVSCVLAEVSR